ncbi:AMP deaminase [[Candida] railenensis]|uniref:AMP deaminase n=1 Tax=[Candida] railenensis TaxID=45579 RepID=A0A9P0QT89_9ASCO|nr:AMP deaminase [[Candida] railenensis]
MDKEREESPIIDGYDGDVRNYDSNSDDESLSKSHQSTHFSSAEEKFMKLHDLKVQAFEALHSGNNHHHDSTSTLSSPADPLMSASELTSSSSALDTTPSSQLHSKLSESLKSPIKRRQSIIDLPQNHQGFVGYHSHPSATPTTASQQAKPKNAIPEEYASDELIELYENIRECLAMRHKYLALSNQNDESINPKNKPEWEIYPSPPLPTYKSKNRFNQLPAEGGETREEEFQWDKVEKEASRGKFKDYELVTGAEDIYNVIDPDTKEPIVAVPSLREYYLDLNKITRISSDGPSKSFAFKRLQFLETKWNMYYLLNEYEETKESKKNPHRDFYNVRKVDTHIHHSACMNQKHLLRFIKYKLKTEPNEQVIFRDGKILTLSEVFKSLNLTGYDLSIDTLDMHAHTDTFHRFDKFNLKYNPIGESRLREIFLKTDNFIDGKYLAELTKQVFEDLESSKYQHVELRISIYGRSISEWDKLSSWIVDNKLFSHNVRWLIQVPRLYDLYKKNGNVESFQDILTNLFKPLFEVSIDPSSHPKLHVFLQRVVGFDSVDDESKSEKLLSSRKFPRASEWKYPTNPPYSYYLYYIFANMTSLNNLRERHGLNTFLLRPHCGEAGDPEHLISAFLTSHSISHGILLRKIPLMQYLYYLDQIGLAMSPLSNNALFLTYDKNPFYSFYKKGMNVSLSTDDPLQFSFTKEPLIEEYSVAAQIYKLSGVDMCELACNSVKQSGWETAIKKHWLGKKYLEKGVSGNDIEKTNIPDIRIKYREETLQSELELISYYTGLNKKRKD